LLFQGESSLRCIVGNNEADGNSHFFVLPIPQHVLLQFIDDLHLNDFLRELSDYMLCGIFEGEAFTMVHECFVVASELEGGEVALKESALLVPYDVGG